MKQSRPFRAIANRRTVLTIFMLSMMLVFGVHAQQKPAESKDKASSDAFAIPEKLQTIEELRGFLNEVTSKEPEGQTQEDLIAHHRKVARTVVNVSDKILSLEPSDEQAMESYSFKIQGLQILKELGEPNSTEEFAATIAEARADARPDVAAIGMKYFIESGFAAWATLDEEDKSELIEVITQYVSQSGAGVEQLQLTLTVVDFLGDMDSDEFAKQLLNAALPGFQKSEDEQIQANLPMLEGVSRRMNLPGQQIELSGTMLDGTPLDWESYRGKVVLVDFWATWCGPCRAEVPNVLKLYHAYHNKGFDVLGISLDNTEEQALSYIDQAEIPWETMFSENEDERGWDHPMARYYGVNGIPRAILVDREGKVVSMNARGKELARLLRDMLGEPVAQTGAIQDKLVQQVSDQKVAQ